MRKVIIKSVVLICVFVVSVIGFSFLTGKGNADLTTEMKEATLPVISFKNNDTWINELYGYTKSMDAITVRDTITPLAEDLVLNMRIQTYQYRIDEISYEVRSIDTSKLLENTQVKEFEQKDGRIITKLNIQNLLDDEVEYILILTINGSSNPVYYYTRILKSGNSYINESIDFSMDFHQNTIEKNESQLVTFLEPLPDTDNATLHKVTIHSNFTQVTWADFEGERISKPIPSIKEIGSSYNTIILNYIMTTLGENGESQYYNVEEYYCVRYSHSFERMSLLDYERTMNQIFRLENRGISENNLQLGIRSSDVEQMANETNTIVSFIQEGELWSYNSNTNQLAYIYSFRGVDDIKNRENLPWHDIKILKVDEMGSTDFVVIGYMNRGEHEGECGIAVYHYDSLANTIEEVLFAASDKAYEILKEEWGKLFYISDDSMFYMLGGDVLYEVDLKSKEANPIVYGLSEGSYSVSESGQYIAWQEEDDIYRSLKLQIMDLENDKKHTIEAEKGKYIKPVGFIKNDLAYGITAKEDVKDNLIGETIYPMEKIVIIDQTFQIVKEYEEANVYMEHAYVDGNTIFFNQILKTEAGLEKGKQNTIKLRSKLEGENVINVGSTVTERKQSQVHFSFEDSLSLKTPQVLTPKVIAVEEKRNVALKETQREKKYYVYLAGKVIYSSKSVTEAIQMADKSTGAVLDSQQTVVWKKGKTTSSHTIENVVLNMELGNISYVNRCLLSILQVEGTSMDVEALMNQNKSPTDILKGALPESKVFNFTGVTMDQVLYYVSNNTPVFGMIEQDKAVLIVGYDGFNVQLYNPESNAVEKMGLQDSDEMFQNKGNVFIGYIN